MQAGDGQQVKADLFYLFLEAVKQFTRRRQFTKTMLGCKFEAADRRNEEVVAGLA